MLYFDTSFLTPLILEEDTSAKVEAFLTGLPAGELAISHWTRTEFASLLAREVRMRTLTPGDAWAALAQFDRLTAESFHVLTPHAADFDLATEYLKHHETGLRAGDALHLAIARNHGAHICYSLDQGLLKAARLLGLSASRGIEP